MEQELLDKIEQLERELNEIKQGNITSEFLNNLQTAGFIREIGPRIITYTNPAGKDLFATFIEFKDEIQSVSVNSQNYYLEIDSVNTSTDRLNIKNHGISDGTQVQISSTDTPPGGLSIQTFYFVVNSTTDDLQLSLTSGGSAVNITSNGEGFHYINGV